eukprot:scaffold4148_cov240-Pinguiococcus_pyrenoidosus.AAC.4
MKCDPLEYRNKPRYCNAVMTSSATILVILLRSITLNAPSKAKQRKSLKFPFNSVSPKRSARDRQERMQSSTYLACGSAEQAERIGTNNFAVRCARLTEIAQGLLGGSHFLLPLAELVAEGNDEAAVALPLVAREREDAREVVAQVGMLLLREVSHGMVPSVVKLAQDVEEERIDVVVERLVIQEQLREVAEVLAVFGLDHPIHLEDANLRRVPTQLGSVIASGCTAGGSKREGASTSQQAA